MPDDGLFILSCVFSMVIHLFVNILIDLIEKNWVWFTIWHNALHDYSRTILYNVVSINLRLFSISMWNVRYVINGVICVMCDLWSVSKRMFEKNVSKECLVFLSIVFCPYQSALSLSHSSCKTIELLGCGQEKCNDSLITLHNMMNGAGKCSQSIMYP
jgi:hypothetical protein